MWEALTKKIAEPKMCKIRGDFGQLQTSIADVSEINYNPSHVRQQKLGEIWSTNKKL